MLPCTRFSLNASWILLTGGFLAVHLLRSAPLELWELTLFRAMPHLFWGKCASCWSKPLGALGFRAECLRGKGQKAFTEAVSVRSVWEWCYGQHVAVAAPSCSPLPGNLNRGSGAAWRVPEPQQMSARLNAPGCETATVWEVIHGLYLHCKQSFAQDLWFIPMLWLSSLGNRCNYWSKYTQRHFYLKRYRRTENICSRGNYNGSICMFYFLSTGQCRKWNTIRSLGRHGDLIHDKLASTIKL